MEGAGRCAAGSLGSASDIDQLPPLALNFPQDFCGELARFLYLDWIPRHRPDTVVLSGLWRRDEEPALAESIRYLKTAGVRQVILLGVSVKYSDDLPDLLARGILYRRKLTDPLPDPSIWRSNDRLAGIAARAGAVYVDLLEVICPGKACRSQIDGTPLLFDSNHYTAEAAAFIARSIAGRL